MNTTLLFMGIGTGKGVRSFKEGMNEVEDNLKETNPKKEETTSNEKKEK